MSRAIPPGDIAPELFFVEWVPTAVADDPARRERLEHTEAVLWFELEGEGGGHFTIEVDRGTVAGRIGAPAIQDLHVRLDVTTWRALNAGALSAPEAFMKRRVQLQGNFRLAMLLHAILG